MFTEGMKRTIRPRVLETVFVIVRRKRKILIYLVARVGGQSINVRGHVFGQVSTRVKTVEESSLSSRIGKKKFLVKDTIINNY
jgi:hypothetical protein